MVTSFLGLGAALVGALGLAGTYLFLRLGTDDGLAIDGILVVMITNLVVLIPIIGVIYYPAYGLTIYALGWFAAAGLAGTLIGRATAYTSVERIGASRTSPIVSGQVLVATVAGILILGERVTPFRGLGIVLVIAGVVTISWETASENPDDLPLSALLVGLLLPLAAAVAFGIEPIFAKFGLAEGTPAPVGLVIRIIAGTIGFVLFLWSQGRLPALATLTEVNTRWFVLAGLANSVFAVGYYLSLSLAPVNIVVPIVQSYPVIVVLVSAIVMPERLERVTWRLAAATVVVVVGVVIVTTST